MPGLSCGIAVVRPQSIGYLRIKSAGPARASGDPAQLPARRRKRSGSAIDAIRLTRKIVHSGPLARFEPEEIMPGAACESDEDILAYARRTVITVFHQSGTCKMGHDPMAVVDERLRVRGIEGLRVIDASIMPNVISGNTNAPTMMIGEKGAAMIREDRRAGAVAA